MKPTTTQITSALLALTLTTVSLAISFEAGQLRGGTDTTRTIWTASNCAVTAAVILLPALTAPENWKRTLPIWLTAFAVVVSGHIQFAIRADAEAAQARLERLATTEPAPDAAARSESAIQRDITRATASARWQTGTALENAQKHIAALQSELQTVTSSVTARQKQRDHATADPVAEAISGITGIQPSSVTTITAVLLSVTLDMLAMTLWTLSANHRGNPGVTAETPGASSPDATTEDSSTVAPAELAQVIQLADHLQPESGDPADARYKLALDAVKTEQIKPTVAAIREHLGCRQIHAQRIAQRIKHELAA